MVRTGNKKEKKHVVKESDRNGANKLTEKYKEKIITRRKDSSPTTTPAFFICNPVKFFLKQSQT